MLERFQDIADLPVSQNRLINGPARRQSHRLSLGHRLSRRRQIGPYLLPKIVDRILSSRAMTPPSGGPRNSDLRPIGNFGQSPRNGREPINVIVFCRMFEGYPAVPMFISLFTGIAALLILYAFHLTKRINPRAFPSLLKLSFLFGALLIAGESHLGYIYPIWLIAPMRMAAQLGATPGLQTNQGQRSIKNERHR